MKAALVIVLILASSISHASDKASRIACDIAYQYVNFLEPKTLKVDSVAGRLIDQFQRPIPVGCAGLFPEDSKEVFASEAINSDGAFRFDNVPKGRYRLVVEVRGFLSANQGVIVTRRLRHESLIVHMEVGRLDSSSYSLLEPEPLVVKRLKH